MSLSDIKSRIAGAEAKFSKPLNSTSLIAVSKLQPNERVLKVLDAGHREFGENYVQEALEKIRHFNPPDINWHFIGPIQSNKTRAIANNFSWVHSVDRLKIAERLSAQKKSNLADINICIQINVDDEKSKSGGIKPCLSLGRIRSSIVEGSGV